MVGWGGKAGAHAGEGLKGINGEGLKSINPHSAAGTNP